MKALSLWQPWASLIATGAKTIETRSWPTSYRGELLIHAAKGGIPKTEMLDLLSLHAFQRGLAPLRGYPLDLANDSWGWVGVTTGLLPRGAIVAVCRLVGCVRTEDLTVGAIAHEREFGDYTPGRFGWRLSNVRALSEPIPCAGARGLWDPPPEIVAAVHAAIRGDA